jgi:hypothetical protein
MPVLILHIQLLGVEWCRRCVYDATHEKQAAFANTAAVV